MRLEAATKAKRIQLPAMDGKLFDSDQLAGKPFMLSFLRFASCPFCNLRVNQLVQRYDELGPGFTIVVVFNSSVAELTEHTAGHAAPFPILADKDRKYYKVYGIENSIFGVLKGVLFRLPTLIRALRKGYRPEKTEGSLTSMPADFLIDAKGVNQLAYYGSDEGDHLPFDQIKEFAQLQRASK